MSNKNWERCVGCGGLFKLGAEHSLCENCCEKIECGLVLEKPGIPDEKVDMELQLHRVRQGVFDITRALDILNPQRKEEEYV